MRKTVITIFVLFLTGCIQSSKDNGVLGDLNDISEVRYQGANQINTKACVPFTIRTFNKDDQLITAISNMAVSLQISGQVAIYSDLQCETPNATLVIPKDEFRATAYLKGEDLETVELSYKGKTFQILEVSTFSNQFSQNLNGSVLSLLTMNDLSGDVYVGGNFTDVNSENMGTLVRLQTDGQINKTFLTSFGVQGNVRNILHVNDDSNHIYITGQARINDFVSRGFGSISSFGQHDPAFASTTGSDFQGTVRAMAKNASGDIYVGGRPSQYGGQNIRGLVRLSPTGELDNFVTEGQLFNFSLTSLSGITSVAVDENQKIYATGSFTTFGDGSPNYGNFVRLHPDGTLDNNFPVGLSGQGRVVMVDENQKIYVGGDFTLVNGVSQRRLTRLNPNGTIDTDFLATGGFDGRVHAIAIDKNQKIYVGGDFNDFNGTPVAKMVRLHPDGTLDTDFTVEFNGLVNAIAIANDFSQDVWVGGEFTQCNGEIHHHLVRLDAQGNID